MTECNHDCSSCAANCGSRTQPQDFSIKANENSSVKKVIGVVSGKGGVGKSLVTSLLACASQRAGLKTAILDGDITGPSIAQSFGLNDRLYSTETAIIPAYSSSGIKIVSTNLMLDDPAQPVVWRGAILSGVVKQFFSETDWGEVDLMFVDLPPGTGDVPLTVFQSIPLDGIIIVTTPQQLVRIIVEKAVNMARMMNIPVLGLIENMSYVECDNCGNKMYIFGQSHAEELCRDQGLDLLAQIPINTALTEAVDKGEIEAYPVSYLDGVVEKLAAE